MKDNQTPNFLFKFARRKRTVSAVSFALGILVSIVFISLKLSSDEGNLKDQSGTILPPETNPLEIKRLKGYKNIQPVVSIDAQNEYWKYAPLKANLEAQIAQLKKDGEVTEVSIFFKNLNRGHWMSINGKQGYHPASLMKVPLMLAVLKAAEANPGLLKKEIVYQKQPNKQLLPQHFQFATIEEGKAYTVHELLFYCIANSDNNASHALESNVNLEAVLKLFGDIGLPIPNLNNSDYTLSTEDYSDFMAAIFYSAFLSPDFSEYAADMMGSSEFKEGFAKGLPNGIKSWRKFGEWVRPGADVELHESGIYFMDGRPYLLTVMTKGKDFESLAKVIQIIAETVSKQTTKADFGNTNVPHYRYTAC